MKKNSTLRYNSWWIFGIIGAIIALSLSNSNDTGIYLFIGISNGVGWGFVLGWIADSVINSNTAEKITEKITESKEKRELVKSTKKTITEYNDARKSYRYLSSETLVAKRNSYLKNKVENILLLALEEEMVERGILEFSPMHEKMEKIKDLFQ